MKEPLKSAMMTSISEVLETMFFMSLEIRDDEPWDNFFRLETGKNDACRITFRGPISGAIKVFMPQKLLKVVTENFLGQDQDSLEASHLQGTLKEIINMIAGNTFSTFDQKAVFELGIPEIIKGDASQAGADAGSEQVGYLIETMDGYMAVMMVFHE